APSGKRLQVEIIPPDMAQHDAGGVR
ncbi:conjugal transfer protein TraW, partial [Citrobacter portucalensis]